MTRIYCKSQSQSHSVRSPRAKPGRFKAKRKEDGDADFAPAGSQRSNWRKQLDPDAIDHIADGLEKMVLSWTSADADANSGATPVDSNAPIANSVLLVGCPSISPVLEEMMKGELIKTCRPSMTNTSIVGGGHQTAEASVWYLSPAASTLSPPTNCMDTNLSNLVSASLQSHGEGTQHALVSCAHQNVWPLRMRPTEKVEDGGSSKTAQQRRSKDCSSPTGGEVVCPTKSSPGGTTSTQEPSVASTAAFFFEEKNDAEGGNSAVVQKKKVEELQIALLECAMEYEVKIVEMKMQMLHMRSEQRQKDLGNSCPAKLGSGETKAQLPMEQASQRVHAPLERADARRVEGLRKQLSRSQREKRALARELGRLKARERELAKRDEEILDCQLHEKAIRAQLYEVKLELHKAQATQIEPRKLLSLLPALREWLQTIKKVSGDAALTETFEVSGSPPIDSIVCSVSKEIQALQRALSKLAAKK